MRVELIGGMGVGKSTLCRALLEKNLSCVFEEPQGNPYLTLSYENPKDFGFYSQISFILSNFYTSSRYSNCDDLVFLDYSTITDKAYSSLFLRGRGRKIALEMIDYMEMKEGPADLYVHLVCDRDVQVERIKMRSRDYESKIGPKFVEKLEAYISRYVQDAEKKGARILTVDTTHIDFQRDVHFVTSFTKEIRKALQKPNTWIKANPANDFSLPREREVSSETKQKLISTMRQSELA